MKRKLKSYAWGTALIFVFFVCRSLWFSYHKSPGFSVSKMTAYIPYNKQWEIDQPEGALQERLNEIFNQKFYFFSAGYQAYAFISEDEKTIIKFFRMKRLSHSPLDTLLHPNKAKVNKKNHALVFNAYKLAFEELREDAGLIYIHLNKTHFLKKKLYISDQEGNEYWLDLDDVRFIVQEKAEPLFAHLHKYIEKKDKKGFDKAIGDLLSLIKRRYAKGIGDEDKGIAENYGFIGERPVQFDIGRIYKGKGNFEEEYEEILKRLHWWMHLNPIP